MTVNPEREYSTHNTVLYITNIFKTINIRWITDSGKSQTFGFIVIRYQNILTSYPKNLT